jgi:hypothetical protein
MKARPKLYAVAMFAMRQPGDRPDDGPNNHLGVRLAPRLTVEFSEERAAARAEARARELYPQYTVHAARAVEVDAASMEKLKAMLDAGYFGREVEAGDDAPDGLAM